MGIRKWLLLLLAVVAVGNLYTAERYIDDVLNGTQVVGRLARLAIERHVRDLERIGDPDFPYYFDARQAMRVIDFKQQLRHTKGEWANPRKHDTRIRLEPWQQAKDWILFGWRREGGYRRFTKAIVEVARKNGKTTDAAATINYIFRADRPVEIGPECYCLGPKKEQAKIAWSEARMQLEKHPILRKGTRTYKQNSTVVLHADPAAKLTIWGRDAEAQDGFNPHFALVDEAHLYPGNEAMEVIESGQGAREQPMVYIITTAGVDINASYYQEERTLAVRILERSIDPVPEHVFAIIYTLDEGDDWTDPRVWVKANPNLGVSVRWDYLKQRVQDALAVPSRQNKIKTKNFNLWTQAETRWISDEDWMASAGEVVEAELAGRRCYLGVDLSSSQDITALALCFPPEVAGGQYQFLYRFFIPEDDLIERERRDQVPYTYWVEKGLVITTPGNVIDYNFIEQEILALAQKYEIVEVPHDPWHAVEIVNNLTAEGFLMVPMYQRYSAMAAPTETFEKMALGKQIAHNGNPVMRWMISCTEVKSDRQGNIMPMKPRRDSNGKRIDGVVASIMALGRAVLDQGHATFDVGAVYGKTS